METQRDDQTDGRHQDLAGEVAPATGVRLTTAQPCEPVHVDADGLIGVEIDNRLFSLNAVLRAAYKFTDRCYIFLRSTDDTHFWCATLRPKATVEARELAGEFANELVDQALRDSLEKQFGHLRTLIVAQAFSEGNLLDEQRSEGDYRADPRNIGTPR